MARWFVINLPPWLLLAGLVVVIAVGTAVVQALVRHCFPGLKRGAHNQMANFIFPVVAVVYGFFIGFLVLALWGQVNSADQTTRTEGAAGVQMAGGLHAFGKTDGERIRQSLLAYARAAAAEWPHAAGGGTTPEAENALNRLSSTYDAIKPHNDVQRAFLTSSLASLRDLHGARTARLLQARTNTGPPLSLWLVIFLNSGLVLGFAVIFGTEQAWMHYGMVAAVSVLVGANLFLVTELAYPYVGELSTSPEPLNEVVRFLSSPR
ncbi:DUF4239 domain-containing protein [Streptomyces caniferus]|uniref:DUF4239 domain-containing protein n=1 Tax=Streptomyces caniferus TaxID=285557 RepID=A0A640S5W6_9ACTN|nr:DUF4239 domain-containing protein [Streptomyces caniferus]GFE06853.1 hypothetical protein Scani_31210 [Streptomyces caniferus]